jgi:hexokinase
MGFTPFLFAWERIMSKTEAAYQAKLMDRLQALFPTAFIIRTDPHEYQVIPDILLLVGDRWAMLEVKMSETSPVQPNQPYYVSMFNRMSFASFIYPENEEEVLRDLQSALGPRRQARLSESV